MKKMLAAATAAALAAVALQPVADAEPNASPGSYPAPPSGSSVYSTPGTWTVNGRDWKTRCEAYTSRIRRCFTDIWATRVVTVNGKYALTNDWVFNNLTYLPSPRSLWTGNNLGNATPGTSKLWTSGGRRWKTECDTATTGRNGCRAYIWTTGMTYSNGAFVRRTGWQFNNLVLFSAGSAPAADGRDTVGCNAILPSGFKMNAAGVPYPAVNAGYTPVDAFNPIAVANFVQYVDRSTNNSPSQRTCLIVHSVNLMIKQSTTQAWNGARARWLPYQFEFKANPSAPRLAKGWHSGLGQSATLTAMTIAHHLTKEAKYLEYGREVVRAMDIPYSKGGIKNTLNLAGGPAIWFEEYPTGSFPTTVLNDNNLALLGLAQWDAAHGDPLAASLFKAGWPVYRTMLPRAEVEAPGGMVSSYDLVRGYPVAPLRLVRASGATVTRTTVNGRPQAITQVGPQPTPANRISNGSFSSLTGWRCSGQPILSGGRLVLGGASTTRMGVARTIPAGTFPAGSKVMVQYDAAVTKATTGRSNSLAVQAQSVCGGRRSKLAYDGTARGARMGTYSFAFTAPAAGCTIDITVFEADATLAGTVAVDNIVVRAADAGSSTAPAYDYYVWRTPVNTITIHGTGTVSVQALQGGRWNPILKVTASPQGRTVQIPERYTGRNVNLKYHEAHIRELAQLARRTGDQTFLNYRQRWLPTALNTPG